MNSWHATPEDLAAYHAGGSGSVLAASIEAHLLKCAACRDTLAGALPPESAAETDRRWAALAAEVDRPRSRTLGYVGIATLPLRRAWFLAVLLVLAVPLAALFITGGGVPTMLLALAPVVPGLAVAASYRVSADPAGELGLATPVAGLRLVAARAVPVSLGAVPPAIALALLGGLPLATALGWLLPGLACFSLVLLAGTTRFDPVAVAGTVGAVWALALAVQSRLRGVPDLTVAAELASAPVQLAALATAAGCLALAWARRDRIAYRRFA